MTKPVAFCRTLYLPLRELLSFIEDRISAYFDNKEKVPDSYLRLVRQEIRTRLAALSDPLAASTADCALWNALRQELLAFSDPEAATPATYKDILYRKDLLDELQDLSAWEAAPSLYSGLEQLLLYLNYNDKLFSNYLVNHLNAAIRQESDVNDKIDLLMQHSKTLQQLQFKPDCALHLKHPSIKVQLSQWLAEELYYQERKISSWVVLPPTGSAPPPAPAAKVVCHASVDQIGIFFRAATDIQLLTTPSQRQLFDQIAPYLATLRRKNLSGDSMRSKSYSPEKKDVEVVKDLLMQLYKKITQY